MIALREAACSQILAFIPCHLEMALSGLSALKVLRERRAVRLALPSIARLRMDTCRENVTAY